MADIRTVCPHCNGARNVRETEFSPAGELMIYCHKCQRIYTASFTPRKPTEEPTLFDVPAQVAGKGHGDS